MKPSERVIWLFDCDGVLIDSNEAKTRAFLRTTARYGTDVAEDVVSHHVCNGGVSRLVKLQRLFDDVLHRPAEVGEMESLLEEFAQISLESLAASRVDPAITSLVEHIRGCAGRGHVVSGGLQDEVQWALEHHGLKQLFDSVRGSPTTKAAHIAALIRSTSPSAGVYVGDSRRDMEVAAEFGLHAVFVSHWTEFVEWPQYVAQRPEILAVQDLTDLLRVLRDRPPNAPDWLRSLP